MLVANKGFMHEGKIYKKGEEFIDKPSKAELATLLKGEFIKEAKGDEEFRSDSGEGGKEPKE